MPTAREVALGHLTSTHVSTQGVRGEFVWWDEEAQMLRREDDPIRDPRDIRDPVQRHLEDRAPGGSSKDRRRRLREKQETLMEQYNLRAGNPSRLPGSRRRLAVQPVTPKDIEAEAMLVRITPASIPWSKGLDEQIEPLAKWRELWKSVASRLRHRNVHGDYFFGPETAVKDASSWWVTSVDAWAGVDGRGGLKERFEDAREKFRAIRDAFKDEWKESGAVERWEEALYLEWELKAVPEDLAPKPPTDIWQAVFWFAMGKSDRIFDPTLRSGIQDLMLKENRSRDQFLQDALKEERELAGSSWKHIQELHEQMRRREEDRVDQYRGDRPYWEAGTSRDPNVWISPPNTNSTLPPVSTQPPVVLPPDSTGWTSRDSSTSS